MSLFDFPEAEVITPYSFEEGLTRGPQPAAYGGNGGIGAWGGGESRGAAITTLGLAGTRNTVSLVPDGTTRLNRENLQDQFVVFQVSNQPTGPTILDSSRVEPTVDGSAEEPDVLVSLEMLSFNVGADENIDKDTRATLRLNFGKDENSRDKVFDTVFWSIAAGLNLYDQAKGKKTDSKDLNSDFRKAFGNRPIEIPGGLGKLSFEVVKHEEPKWYQKIFSFLGSEAAKSLISVLGFPAITYQAIGVLNELLNRLEDARPEVLFKSLPMRLALSKQARSDFTGGNPRIKMGCLTPGFCILARGGDFETIASANASYYPAFGKLVPDGVSDSDLLAGRYDDPFRDVTYAVFRLGMKKTRLDPTFNFGSG